MLIEGRVQGVGYRQYVLEAASELGLMGEVWNRFDGKVEVLAWHEDPEVLDLLEERLPDGPGQVRSVTATEEREAEELAPFEIGPTR
jgi:acylphosphatase